MAPISKLSHDSEEGLSLIDHYYRQHYEALERNGTAPYRLTALGAWAASRASHVFTFFKAIDLSRYRFFIDLGSGDGVVTCIAGLFTRAVGIEIDPELCCTGQRAAQILDLYDHVHFICADFRTQRIRQADCLYLYPDKPFYALEELLDGWQGTLVVYGPHMPPKRLVPVQQLRHEKERLVLYHDPSAKGVKA